jgi:hypothetical protein
MSESLSETVPRSLRYFHRSVVLQRIMGSLISRDLHGSKTNGSSIKKKKVSNKFIKT